ncbi:MAG TPA: hypothetical protein VLB47_11260, partial [Solirubrobacteraceae bacterium]|nr:hypothetical protein [Solirubrobacteraceae bacterium]
AILADGTAVTVWARDGIHAAARPPGGDFQAAEPLRARGRFPALGGGGDVALAVWLRRGALMAAARAG